MAWATRLLGSVWFSLDRMVIISFACSQQQSVVKCRQRYYLSARRQQASHAAKLMVGYAAPCVLMRHRRRHFVTRVRMSTSWVLVSLRAHRYLRKPASSDIRLRLCRESLSTVLLSRVRQNQYCRMPHHSLPALIHQSRSVGLPRP